MLSSRSAYYNLFQTMKTFVCNFLRLALLEFRVICAGFSEILNALHYSKAIVSFVLLLHLVFARLFHCFSQASSLCNHVPTS